ncbi:MAG: flagellar motor protein MotB [Tissierellales bacterium]|jgi:chemotaxis protein MotB|nr:flagellar motor protein MotB [Tissierellales bacterium]
MAKKNKCPECPPEDTSMATYGDMVTLLLCFFVLLFSFAEIDAQKFQAIMQSFDGSLGVMEGGKTISEFPFINMGSLPEELTTDSYEEVDTMTSLKKEIEDYVIEEGVEDSVEVIMTEKGLIIRVMDSVFFDSGKADIKTGAKEIILFIGELLSDDRFDDRGINIEGHTDNVPMNTAQFPSNWELSAIRAVNVLKILETETRIDSSRLSASGYGPNRPIALNDTPQNRALNRRVDIVVLNSNYSKAESE